MLLRFLAHACEHFGLDTPAPRTYAQLEETVHRALTQLGAQRKVVVIVDGADHFDTDQVPSPPLPSPPPARPMHLQP